MSSKQTYPKFRKREIMILDKKKKKKKSHRAHDEASMYNMISTLTS